MNKNISKTKLFFVFISLIITFFVWQQGLRDSLSRPSVNFDISQKEKEITELALPVIPINLKNSLFINDPIEDINTLLSDIPFDELTDRNKLIWIISSNNNEVNLQKDYLDIFDNKKYLLVMDILSKSNLDNSFKPNHDFLDSFKEDRFLYHLLSKKFYFD